MITVLVVLVAAVLFVLGAAARVSRDAGEYDEQLAHAAWIHELHAEAPHEFVVETPAERADRLDAAMRAAVERDYRVPVIEA